MKVRHCDGGAEMKELGNTDTKPATEAIPTRVIWEGFQKELGLDLGLEERVGFLEWRRSMMSHFL